MTPIRFICSGERCANIFDATDERASGLMCPKCGMWSSKTTSPAGRWIAFKHGIHNPDADGFCKHMIPVEGLPDHHGAPLCPNRSDGDSGFCDQHRPRIVGARPNGGEAECDWCHEPVDERDLRKVPGERVGGEITGRQMMVCRGCAGRMKLKRGPDRVPDSGGSLSLFDALGAAS